MSYETRKAIYERIESERSGRPLIVYATSNRVGAYGSMADDVIPEFVKQVQLVPAEKREVDVLLVSRGGDPMVAWRIVTLLRERFDAFDVLLPYEAYSAATLLALGANNIIMHPFSNLGPVDPQMVIPKKADSEGNIQEQQIAGAEDVRSFLEFVREDVKVSDQAQLEKALELVCKDVGALRLGGAKRAIQLSVSLAEKLLNLHITDSSKAKAISEALSHSFYHHGYAVGPKEAKDMGLPITYADGNLKDLIWSVWESIQEEMECLKPFDIISIVLNDPNAGPLLQPVQMVQLPMNLPVQLVPQLVANAVRVVDVPPAPMKVLTGVLESIRLGNAYRLEGVIQAYRGIDLKLNFNPLYLSMGWQ